MFKPRPDKLLLKSVLTDADLGHLWDDWEKVLRPTVYLKKEMQYGSENANEIPIGASKLLGFPDLPPDVPIPFDGNGNQCGFVGQINLADVAALDIENLLPKTGLLSFFASEESYGSLEIKNDPVFYFSEGTPLVRQKITGSDYYNGRYGDHYLSPSSLCFVGGWMAPSTLGLYDIRHLAQTPLGFLPDEETYEEYNDFISQEVLMNKRPIEVRLNSSGAQLLGYPDDREIIEPLCELVRRGIIKDIYDTSSPDWYKTNQILLKSVEKQAFQDWICLFEDNAFNPVFLLDYMIHRDDLANLDFSKVICNASRCG
jgi:uncharacterized protein YwqG